jgi:hypothetical protein
MMVQPIIPATLEAEADYQCKVSARSALGKLVRPYLKNKIGPKGLGV